MELHAQGRVAVPTTLPLDVERTKTVRPGPSGSAIHMERCVQGRVAVPPTLPLDVERTGCTPLHCHSTSSVPRRCAQARVAVPPTLPLDVERTGCTPSHCHSTSSARAARPHTATRRRAHGLHALTLPLDVERTKTVRSGPSGSANHMELHAQGRVAVPLTLPLDVERTGCTPLHCHSTSSVPKRCVQGRMAGPPRRPSGATAGQGVCRPPGCRERRESDERCARDLRPTGATPGAARACQTAEEMRTLRRNR